MLEEKEMYLKTIIGETFVLSPVAGTSMKGFAEQH